MHSFVSFTCRSLGKSRFDGHPQNPVAEGEPACRSFLPSVLRDANRTADDDHQGRDLCDPFGIFAGWEVGAWPGLLVWSSSGWTRLITGQCHFWTLSKGLGWGSDCQIRPLLLRRELADKSEAGADVAPVSTWTDCFRTRNIQTRENFKTSSVWSLSSICPLTRSFTHQLFTRHSRHFGSVF